MAPVIYFYSATGNSYDVAKEIALKMSETKIQSLVPLAPHITVAPDEIIGLIFPVYDWNIPLIVREFLEHLDVSGTKYVFAVATCNYLPGCALDTVKNILLKKGCKLNAGFVIHMPGTYLPLYGANSLRTQKIKFANKVKKTDRIVNIVRQRLNHRIEHSPFVIDRILGTKMEATIERFAEEDREFIVENACNGCGICKMVCPFDNIEMVDGKPHWRHRCQKCLACVHFCAKNCIQLGNKTQGKLRYKNPAVPLKEIIKIVSEGNKQRDSLCEGQDNESK